jgi:hypothetical protein
VGTRPTPDPTAAGETLRLSPARRAWRVAALGGLATLFLLGSVVGQDDWWPFGPWRMFATSSAPSGSVIAFAVQVQTEQQPGWHDVGLSPASIGLNRAEVEGRSGVIEAHPQMLGTLAASHARLRPNDEPWRAVRLVRRETVLQNRVPTGEVREAEIAVWRRSS